MAENAPPLGQLKMFMMSLQLNNSQGGRIKFKSKLKECHFQRFQPCQLKKEVLGPA